MLLWICHNASPPSAWPTLLAATTQDIQVRRAKRGRAIEPGHFARFSAAVVPLATETARRTGTLIGLSQVALCPGAANKPPWRHGRVPTQPRTTDVDK